MKISHSTRNNQLFIRWCVTTFYLGFYFLTIEFPNKGTKWYCCYFCCWFFFVFIVVVLSAYWKKQQQPTKITIIVIISYTQFIWPNNCGMFVSSFKNRIHILMVRVIFCVCFWMTITQWKCRNVMVHTFTRILWHRKIIYVLFNRER